MTVEDSDLLFDEATSELLEDVNKHLEEIDTEMPDGDTIFATDTATVVASLEQIGDDAYPEAIEQSLKQAKKAYILGERADAFSKEQRESLNSQIEDTKDTLEQISGVQELALELGTGMERVQDDIDSLHTTGTEDADTDAGKPEEEEDADADTDTDTDTDTDADAGEPEEEEDADADTGEPEEEEDADTDADAEDAEEEANDSDEDDDEDDPEDGATDGSESQDGGNEEGQETLGAGDDEEDSQPSFV